ncbi:MAG: hypothetical protein M3Y71_02200 [Actinomycetota bacterium]|nr:hypothetical protein [Actinomycetota bacterium]
MALSTAVVVASAVLALPSHDSTGPGPTGRAHGWLVWAVWAVWAVWLVWAARWRRRRRGADDAQLVVLLDLLVPSLRAGLPVAAALGQLPRDGTPGGPPARDGAGWVEMLRVDLGQEAAAGRPLAQVWADHASAAGSCEGAFVARAWGLSETLGAPLAESVAEAASAVRQRIARAQRLEVAVAGPRATARVLTLLPLAGPLVAIAMGIPPGQLYSGLGGVCALVGLLLLLVGRLWCARLVRRVMRPMTVAELR